MWASDKVNLDEISSQELSNAYSEAQTKLKTMRCLLISQFLNQEKHKTGTGLSGGVTSSTAMVSDTHQYLMFYDIIKAIYQSETSLRVANLWDLRRE